MSRFLMYLCAMELDVRSNIESPWRLHQRPTSSFVRLDRCKDSIKFTILMLAEKHRNQEVLMKERVGMNECGDIAAVDRVDR